MKKKIAIIIVIYNGEAYLRDCFNSLDRINYPRDLLKIILVDNASVDHSLDLIKRYTKKNPERYEIILNKKNLGFAAGNNIGIKWALDRDFDYIYLLNQDTIVDPDFLIEATKALDSDNQVGAAQSLLMLWPEKDKVNSLGNNLHFLGFGYAGGHQSSVTSHQFGMNKEIAYTSGAASLWQISALKEIGLFDDKFYMYHEDLDLGWRLRLAGYKSVLAAGSVIYHKYSFSKSIKKYYWMERNRFICLLTNYKIATLILILPAFLIMEAGLFVFSFINGFWGEKIKCYFWIINPWHWPYLVKRRFQIIKIRKAKDHEVVRLFTGKIEFQEINNPILKYFVNPIFNLYWLLIKKIVKW
jgi:GT2 family glycosyltransferase